MITEHINMALVNKSSQAIEAIIADPGDGKRIAVDYINLTASGGANTLTLTGNIAAIIGLANTQQWIASNDIQDPEGIFHCNDSQAFSLTLANATAVQGWVNYRIING